MKQPFLFVSMLFAALQMAAQPTMTSSSMPSVGYSFSTSSVDLGSANEGPAGANVLWDFSSLIDTGEVTSLSFIDPSDISQSSSFPGTNIAITGNQAGNTFYSFINLSSSSVDQLGTYVSSTFGDVFNINENPMTQYQFPATYNSTATDSYRSAVNLDLGFASVNTTTTGQTSYLVDAYGTLINWSGTYNNVLRFKHREVSFDTTYSTSFGQSDTTYSESHSTSYEWVSVIEGGSIPIFSISYDTTFADGNVTPSISADHTYNNDQTGIQSVSSENIQVFPNPSNGKINMSIPAGVENISITDLSGRVLLSQKPVKSSTTSLQELDITALPSGIYCLQLQSEKGIRVAKVIRN